jgi:hypothetical protein
MNVVQGGIFLTRGCDWASGIPTPERDAIVERILQLPAWLSGDASAANLDVTSLEGAPGFYRLRVGRYRAIFQRLGMDILLHGVETRGAVYAPHRLRSLRFVRDRSGLRLLARQSSVSQKLEHPSIVAPWSIALSAPSSKTR